MQAEACSRLDDQTSDHASNSSQLSKTKLAPEDGACASAAVSFEIGCGATFARERPRSSALRERNDSSDCGDLSSRSAMLRPSAIALPLCLAHGQISCANATLVGVLAAPCLLGNRPSLHPICKSRIAVVGSGWTGVPALTIFWAAFAMDVAAPLLLIDRPPRLPLCVVVCTIEGVHRARLRCL